MSKYQLVTKSISDKNVLLMEQDIVTKETRIVNINRLTGTEQVYTYAPEHEGRTKKIYINVAELLGVKIERKHAA